MASNPVPFRSPKPKLLGTGEAKRRMQSTTNRSDLHRVQDYAAKPLPCDQEVALLTSSSDFKHWQATKSRQGIAGLITHAIQALQLSPLACWLLAISMAVLGLLICLLYTKHGQQYCTRQDQASSVQSFATIGTAQQELQANGNSWSPPGTLLAAASTFSAALKHAEHTSQSLLEANHALTQEAATAKENADAANIKSDGLQIRIKQCSTHAEQLQTSAHAAETERVRLQHEQTALQAQLKAVSAQKQELEAAADLMYSKLQKLEPILPELTRATSKAQKCQEDMNKLSGSQAKVHATIQFQQQQQQELQNSLAAAQHQLSLVTQDYAVCTDVSSTIQTEHDKLQAVFWQTLVVAVLVFLMLGAGSLRYVRHIRRKLKLAIARAKSQFRHTNLY